MIPKWFQHVHIDFISVHNTKSHCHAAYDFSHVIVAYTSLTTRSCCFHHYVLSLHFVKLRDKLCQPTQSLIPIKSGNNGRSCHLLTMIWMNLLGGIGYIRPSENWSSTLKLAGYTQCHLADSFISFLVLARICHIPILIQITIHPLSTDVNFGQNAKIWI